LVVEGPGGFDGSRRAEREPFAAWLTSSILAGEEVAPVVPGGGEGAREGEGWICTWVWVV
jgi:hypothetical protein